MEMKELPPRARAQVERQIAQQKKRSKYGNVQTVINGIKFDSKKEANRYSELKQLFDAGLITDLKLQHNFTLQEAFKTPDGEAVRKIAYIADFTYCEDGKLIVEDVKSAATKKDKVYSLKKRMMADKGYIIHEV